MSLLSPSHVCMLLLMINCLSCAFSEDENAVVEAVLSAESANYETIGVRKEYTGSEMRRDSRLDLLMRNVVKQTCDDSRRHSPSNVSATIIDLGYIYDPLQQPIFGSWRGDAKVFPASVVKVFYMAAAYVWQRESKLTITPSVYRKLKFMIGPSSNVATQDILNLLCDVESGSALSASEFRKFAGKREAVNEWLRSLGLYNTNANQATWDDKYSPRDLQLVTGNLDGNGPHVNRNVSTSNDIARFFLMIAQNRIGSIEDCDAMRKLMERKAEDRHRGSGYRRIFQDRLPSGTTIWGKSGFTSETSHDAAIITTPEGRRFILVVMTEGFWDNTPFLGNFAVKAMKGLKEIDPTDHDRVASSEF